MNVAIITANIGGIDEVKPFPGQHKLEEVHQDYFCIEEHQLREVLKKEGLDSANDRLVSRCPKFMTHKLLPGYDVYIWLDARVQVVDKDFTGFMLDNLEEVKIALHPDRKTIGEETEHILERLKNNDKYLLPRMSIEDIEKQKAVIGEKSDLPIYCLRVFSRINSEKVNEFYEKIWQHCLDYGDYDQLMWAYECDRMGIKVNTYIETGNPYYKIDKHKILK